ncbi:hypothetical protein [Vineibacter terrae]|uniref:phage adaptor protein n=1 Tax=Vineibacter terrae TaxID=2586908 RepID=UPI002E318774|nr:hypothetical protein [Vineibacter terrae]HEX2887177.1 hypothetical protein [Vineibacter terrae]
MATLADLSGRIQDDLDRADLALQIGQAIRDAVEHYESERFAFNEVTNVTATFGSGADVIPLASLPVYLTKIDRIRLQVSGAPTLTDLIPRDYAWLMAGQDVKAICRPGEYCVYAEQLQLDSRPDQAYLAVLDGVQRISTASAATDSSAWFNEGRHLVRARAKADLYAHVVKALDQAQVMTALEQRAFRSLKQKLNARNAGRIRPTIY